jgi:hypothetical protein
MKPVNTSLFSQLISLVDRSDFSRLVRETGAEGRSKGFASWDQFVAMLFCQLGQARSLREITGGLRSCEGKMRHLGLEEVPGRSTLAYANEHRPAALFERLFHMVLASVRHYAPGNTFHFKHKLFSLDSTVIPLCAAVFDWAKYRAAKGAAKVHLLLDHDGLLPCFAVITEGRVADCRVAQRLELPKGALVVIDRGYIDYRMFERWSDSQVGFVTRMKSKADWYSGEVRHASPEGLIRLDETGEFNVFQAGRKVRGVYRRVVLWLEDKQETMELLTNRLDLSAETIAAIYKQRWQIELFFKAIKQNLRIKTFVGTSANAVHTQVWTALISFLLLKMLQFRSKKNWTLSTLVALLRWNLFTHKNLWTWLEDPEAVPPDIPSESNPVQTVLDSIFGPAPHLAPAT